MCSQKEGPTKFETSWLQEINIRKELTITDNNYFAPNSVWMRLCLMGWALRKFVKMTRLAPLSSYIFRFNRVWINNRLYLLFFSSSNHNQILHNLFTFYPLVRSARFSLHFIGSLFCTSRFAVYPWSPTETDRRPSEFS